MNEKTINKQLNLLTVALLLAEAMLVVSGETGLLPNGAIEVRYEIQMAVCMTTVIAVPLALKWMNFDKINLRVAEHLPAYRQHSVLRLLMLAVPMLGGIVFHYLMMDSSMLYCSLIALMGILFVWPSESRMQREMTKKELPE